jgi:hypothetical protein
MAKENTHLFMAHKILNKLPSSTQNIINNNLEEYLIGSILPDIFFYYTKTYFISAQIHQNPTQIDNNIILSYLSQRDLTDKDYSFTCGFLTHYITDTIFHPIIHQLAGDFNNKNRDLENKARFRHRLLETYIAKILNSRHHLTDEINITTIQNLDFIKFLTSYVTRPIYIIIALRIFILFNKLNKPNQFSKILWLFNKLHIINNSEYTMTYQSLAKMSTQSSLEQIKATSLSNDILKKTSLQKLTNQAICESTREIENFTKYYNKDINLEQYLKLYDSKNFDTGIKNTKNQINNNAR